MFNQEKLNEMLAQYRIDFIPKCWIKHKEGFKWRAVKQFQDNWDIDAEDFYEMFSAAAAKTYNLLGAMNFFPRRMIREFAKHDPEETRQMFKNLFDENLDLEGRVRTFQEASEKMREKIDDGSKKNHFQKENSISTYLWLRYPDKYYIFRYSEYRAIAKALDSEYMPKKGRAMDNMLQGFKFYDEIRKHLLADSEIMEQLKSVAVDEYYSDPEAITLTIDLGHYAKSYYKQNEENKSDIFKGKEKTKIGEEDSTYKSNSKSYWWLNANPKIWSFSEI